MKITRQILFRHLINIFTAVLNCKQAITSLSLDSTDMRRLTTGLRSEKCAVRRFRRCAKVIECTYTNLHSIAYYTPSVYILYCSYATKLHSMLLY